MAWVWRVALALALVAWCDGAWKWQPSASSVTTSSSTISTSSSVSSSSPEEVEAGVVAREGRDAAQPRFIGSLKKKLCSVGLGFNCGKGGGYQPAQQHYGQPADIHEVQYVQPVEIRPVGKPIPALPANHGFGGGNKGHGNSGYSAPSTSYGAPKAPSSSYGAPKAPSSSYGAPKAPSSSYGAPKAPSNSYGAPKAPSSSYGAPKAPSTSYGAPANTYSAPISNSYSAPPSNSYSAPPTSYNAPAPAQSYSAPSGSSNSYNAPSFTSNSHGGSQGTGSYGGGGGQTVQHVHVHEHTYKFEGSAAAGIVGNFGGSGGYDSNILSGSDNSFLSTHLGSAKTGFNSIGDNNDIQNTGGFIPNALPSTPGVTGGLTSPALSDQNIGPRELGCVCVPQQQCAPDQVVSSPFARQDLSGIQDPRNSPSAGRVYSNATQLRRRRALHAPLDQTAVASQPQPVRQGRELAPGSPLDDFAHYDDILALPDNSQLNPLNIDVSKLRSTPGAAVDAFNTVFDGQTSLTSVAEAQVAFSAVHPDPPSLAPFTSPGDAVIQDVTNQYQQELAKSREGGARECGAFEVCCAQEVFQGAFSSTFNSFANTGSCGLSLAEGINGRIRQPLQQEGDAEFGEYPWQAAVLKKEGVDNVYVCAGTLIDDRHVLTAAHCVKGYDASELRVRLGEWDVNSESEFYGHVEGDVDGVFVNPDFYSGNLINDIAVLRMARPVDFFKNPHVAPVCLPSRGQDFTGQRCWVSGWGKDGFGDDGQYQSILKETDVSVVASGVCESRLRGTRLGAAYRLHPGMICAGGELGKDACKGDGGGPLACQDPRDPQGRYQLAGIVSWGIGCGQQGVPGVYVNVAYYLDWINQITRF